MAVSVLFVCDACAADRVLVHAEEWTPGAAGSVENGPIPYLGYGPVGGLLNRLWCTGCRAVRPHAFVTLNPPGEHAVIAYAEAQRLGCDGTETGPCLECGTPLTWQLDGETCPSCEKGAFRLTGEWEDAV